MAYANDMLREALHRLVLVLATVALVATGALAPVVAMPEVTAVAADADALPCDLPCKGCPAGAASAGCAAFCCMLPATMGDANGRPMACAVPSVAVDAMVGHGRSIRPSPHPPRA